MKKKFIPQQWLSTDVACNVSELPIITPLNCTDVARNVSNISQIDVEAIITRIESKSLDIATAYSDWRDIGFAFSHEFGEQGRNYFHRISSFYADYSATACDKQFNKCLKSKNSGITIKTFCQKAKEAEIGRAHV